MRALGLLVGVLLAGCDWTGAEQAACARTPGCDAGVADGGADGGVQELVPRPLQRGQLVGLVTLGPSRAWAVIGPGDGGLPTGIFTLEPASGAQARAPLSDQVANPRAVFAAPGLSTFSVVEANGRVTFQGEAGAAVVMPFTGIDDAQLISQYRDGAQLFVSVWGRNNGVGYVQGVAAQTLSSGDATPVVGDGCIRPSFHDVEILGDALNLGALVALRAETTGCSSARFDADGAWLQHINNAGTRKQLHLLGAPPDGFAVGRLERAAAVGAPLPVVGYSNGNDLVVADVDIGVVNLQVTPRDSLLARGARFADFVSGSTEPIITGVTNGDVGPFNGASLTGAGDSYAFAARLTQPGWLKRLGPAAAGTRVRGVKVGTSLVFVWETPTGVAWTALEEADGRERR